MSRLVYCALVAGLLLVASNAQAQSNLFVETGVDIWLFDAGLISDQNSNGDLPLASASATIVGLGDAQGSAAFGVLRASARLEAGPEDINFQNGFTYARSSLNDELTINGSNMGAYAQAEFIWDVDGTLNIPFSFVSEITNYAQANFNASASSALDYAVEFPYYNIPFPSTSASFNDRFRVRVDFQVGQPIQISAGLEATTESNVTYNGLLEADFGSTARLVGIRLVNVDDPSITSHSGTNYAVVPEISSMSLVFFAVGMAALPGVCRRWRG